MHCAFKTRETPLLPEVGKPVRPVRRGGRGAETNERSEFVEAGWWNQISKSTTPSPAFGRQAHESAHSVQTHS